MKPATLVRLALAGTRTDALRVVLTGLSALLATLAALAAATVLAIPTRHVTDPNDHWGGNSDQYRNHLLAEPGLRPGLAIALLLLLIPVLALAGQCARLGAPSRDRRLAAIRLAGATPRQAVLIAAGEAGLAGLVGSVAALAVYLVGRRVLGHPGPDGKLALPTDVLPPAPVLAALVLGLPVLAALATAIMLRRVTLSPFGVVRRTDPRGVPGILPGVLIGLGLAAFAAIKPLTESSERLHWRLPGWSLLALLFGGNALALLGVVLGAGWISYNTGRVLHRLARRPAALLAARRLLADPWSGSRTLTALLSCVIFGAGASAFRAYFRTLQEMQVESQRLSDLASGRPPMRVDPDTFYLDTMSLVNLAVLVALVLAAGGLLVSTGEGIVARRRSYANLVAGGVPRGVLGRSIGWQVLAPAVPAILLALAVGAVLGRMFSGDRVTEGGSSCVPPPGLSCTDPAIADRYQRAYEVHRLVPVPFGQLALFGAGALAAVLVTVGVAGLVIRAATSVEELRVG
ncbi:FtsX-like permease family protein [Plantactinospora siamensis]|uniref:FtsX-like permease family protein n=1 Tax=Plantactinospora siamensis TaxID=555372 RepID=A0ABV6NTK5_9ACTN